MLLTEAQQQERDRYGTTKAARAMASQDRAMDLLSKVVIIVSRAEGVDEALKLEMMLMLRGLDRRRV